MTPEDVTEKLAQLRRYLEYAKNAQRRALFRHDWEEAERWGRVVISTGRTIDKLENPVPDDLMGFHMRLVGTRISDGDYNHDGDFICNSCEDPLDDD